MQHRAQPRLRRRVSRLAVVGLAAVSTLTVNVSPAFARAPLIGSRDMGYTPNSSLTFKFAGNPPAWFTGAGQGARLALETEWSNRTFNTSALPKFIYSSTGAGTVIWSASENSPCSGNPGWLACTPGKPADPTAWRIYARDFANSDGGHMEWNESGDCGAQTCFDLSRALIHEAIHLFLDVSEHDGSGHDKTVMGSIQPWKGKDATWNVNHLQPCDEATAQLFYDLYWKNARYSSCLNDVADVPDTGVPTTLAVTGTAFTACTSQVVSVGGRVQVAAHDNLGELPGNPLAGRRIYWDRRPLGTTTWTNLGSTVANGNAGENFTVALASSNVGTMEYKVRYQGDVVNDFLGGSSDTFTIRWTTSPCAV